VKQIVALLAVLAAAALIILPGPPQASSFSAVAIREMVGANVVVNNNAADISRVAGWARDYHKWYWYEPNPNDYRFESGWQFLGSFYRALTGAGVHVMPSVEMSAYWASSNGNRDGVPNADAHADYMGGLAAHFGGTLSAVENFNEPNQTWQPVRFPASQFGVMTAQDYAAVKAANPNLLFVLAGMAGPDTNYLEAAHNASGGKYDVVNFHWYAQGDTASGGKNPEAGALLDHISWVRNWRDARAPGKPIWITEFGWDTFVQPDGRKSKIYAPEASAANYLLRSIFLMQAQGIEKGFVYIYRDPVSSTGSLHATYNSAGLVVNSSERDARKKVGWYYLATLKQMLGDYVLDRVVTSGPNIYHLEYSVPGSGRRAAVLWARNGDRDSGYTVSYTGPAGTLIAPVNGSTTGAASGTDGNLLLSEKPIFVLYDVGAGGNATPTITATRTRTVPPSTTPVPSPTRTGTLSVPTATRTLTPPATATPNSGTPSGDRLSNGGFEDGLTGWVKPGWVGNAAIVDSTIVYSGGHSLRSRGNVAGPYVYQEVLAAPGQTLTLSGWVNVTERAAGSSMTVELVARHANGYDLRTFPIQTFDETTNGWTEVLGQATMPNGTANTWVRLKFSRLNGTFFADAFSLR
jgi:hypothetical protein